jgi:hypothetical protein
MGDRLTQPIAILAQHASYVGTRHLGT